jgi:large subunit ribosomal protein L17
MRHQKAGRKFKRSPSHRRMLLRNLATSLFEHGKIRTTLPKAKEVQAVAEKLITMARGGLPKGDTVQLAKFRRALAVVTRKEICFKLFHEIGPQYAGRNGGYTRIFKLAKVRQGDAAEMAVLSLLGADEAVAAAAPVKPTVAPTAE